ncbi:MAG: hypothetical protein HY686_04230 [Chloroflexi bacterium]|nr:hypothetical protein [Chloroflexota bacterium]
MRSVSEAARTLIGGRFRRKTPYSIIGLLLLGALAGSAWVVWGDLAHRRGEQDEKRVEEAVFPSFTLEELGAGEWRVGDLVPSQGGATYTAPVVDGKSRVIFDLKLDGKTGQPTARGGEGEPRAAPGAPVSTSLDAETARGMAAEVLPALSLGGAVSKEGGAVLEVALRYEARQVATVRVDTRTKTVIPRGQRLSSEGKAPNRPEARRVRWVPKGLVQPVGWLAAMVAVISTLYYSWRRAQTAIVRESPAATKSVAIQRLRGLLRWHEAFGLLALGLAVVHLVDFWGKLQVSTSWLLFFMVVTVVLSGMFREVMGRYQAVRAYWRSFHIPYTALFFAVLSVHVLMKVGLLGED